MSQVYAPTECTEKQAEVLAFITSFLLEHGYQPDYREIGTHFGFASPNGVLCHLKGLDRKGWISIGHARARSIKILFLPDGNPFQGLEFLCPTTD